MNLSIIVPVLNEEKNILPLLQRIDHSLPSCTYEVIFINDHSTDRTKEVIMQLKEKYPLSLFEKKGKKGKAYSLLEGFSYAKYDTLCMIDADLQYPPEAIPAMIGKITQGADIVVATRKQQQINIIRHFISTSYLFLFGKLLHNFNCDVQSGLKVFRKETVYRFPLNPTSWTFDLEFLIHARNAGYSIQTHDITFAKRENGKAKIKLAKASVEIGLSALKLKFVNSPLIPFNQELITAKGEGFHYKGKEFVHHSTLPYKETAFYRLDTLQKLNLLGLLIVLINGLLLNWHFTVVLVLGAITCLYFFDLLFVFYSVLQSYIHPVELHISQKELSEVAPQSWPVYTILCPLYKEWKVIPQFITAINNLEYPKEQLQVMILLEEDDAESIQQVKKMNLPSFFEVHVVPHSLPKTKPKACNYGLRLAKGKYVVIYDAEDIPEPLQLKKVVVAFEKSQKNLACIQAKLNFYNPHQNLLTKAFTAEYSLWFDLVLTGLQSLNAPIPLGGTSNHFRTKELRLLNAWDSFNVTEDCDLGIRLFKKNYQTAIIDSETLEEANSNMRNWFAQRGRWIKGYMQSYLVHMRQPEVFFNNTRKYHFITFQFIVIGKVLSMLINLFMWTTTLAYFLLRPEVGTFIESFFPAPILYIGVTCLVVGNFANMYYYMIGCMKHKHYELLKYTFFIPFYWLAMGIAGCGAVYKLIVAPHYWAKTKHGFHLKDKSIASQLDATLTLDLIPTPIASVSVIPEEVTP